MRKKAMSVLSAVFLLSSLAACGGGGGGGGDTSSSRGSNPASEAGDGVPAQARVDGQAFVSWLERLFAASDPLDEPIKVDDGGGAPVDESGEPRRL